MATRSGDIPREFRTSSYLDEADSKRGGALSTSVCTMSPIGGRFTQLYPTSYIEFPPDNSKPSTLATIGIYLAGKTAHRILDIPFLKNRLYEDIITVNSSAPPLIHLVKILSENYAQKPQPLESELCILLISSIAMRVLTNTINHIKENLPKELQENQPKEIQENQLQKNVTLDNIFELLIIEAGTYPHTFQAIAREEIQKTPTIREEGLKKLFENFYSSLMTIFFRNDPKQLGLPSRIIDLQSRAWNLINNPSHLYSLLSLFSDPALKIATWEKLLDKTPYGHQLRLFALPLAKKITQETRKFVCAPDSPLPDLWTGCLFEEGKPKPPKTISEISSLIRHVCLYNSGHMRTLWDFTSGRLSKLLIKVFLNSSALNEKTIAPNPAEQIAQRIYHIFKRFYLDHSSALKEPMPLGETQRKIWVDAHFKELAAALLNTTGLNDDNILGALNVQKLVNSNLPNWLCLSFEILAKNNKGLLEWIGPGDTINRENEQPILNDNPGKKSEREFLNAISDKMTSWIMNILPSLMNKKNSNEPEDHFAGFLAQSLIKSLAGNLQITQYEDGTPFQSSIIPTSLELPLASWISNKLLQSSENYSKQLADEIIKKIIRTQIKTSDIKRNKQQADLEKLVKKLLLKNFEECNMQERIKENVEEIIALLERDSIDLKKWVIPRDFEKWLIQRLEKIDPDTEKLWYFVEQHISLSLRKVLANIFTNNKQSTFKHIINYFESKERDQSFQNSFLSFDPLTPPDIWIKNHFSPLVDELWLLVSEDQKLKVFDLDLILKTQLANLLFNLYKERHATLHGASKGNWRELCQLLHNPKRLTDDWVKRSSVHIPLMNQEHQDALYITAGIGAPATKIQNGFNALVPWVMNEIRTLASSEKTVQNFNGLLELGLDEATIKHIHHLLANKSDNQTDLLILLKGAEKILENILPKMLTRIAQQLNPTQATPEVDVSPNPTPKSPPTVPTPLDLIVADLLLRILAIFNDQLVSINGEDQRAPLNVRMEKTSRIKAPDEKQEALREIFLPVVVDILNLMGKDVNDRNHPLFSLPIPAGLRKLLWTQTQTFLADAFAQMYQEIEENLRPQKNLEKYASEAARVFGGFTSTFIRHSLSTQAPMLNDLVQLGLNRLDQSKIEAAQVLAKSIKEDHETIKKWTMANASKIGNDSSVPMQKTLKLIEKATEVLAGKVINGIHKTLVAIDDPGFSMKLTTEIMKEVADHITAVNTVTAQLGASKPSKVPNNLMLQGLMARNCIHPSMRLERRENTGELLTSAEDKLKGEMDHFFNPLASMILDISNISANDMPVPKAMQESTFQFVKDQLPTLIKTLYENISPSNDPNRVPGEVFNPLKLLLVQRLKELCAQLTAPIDVQKKEKSEAEEGALLQLKRDDPIIISSGKMIKGVLAWMPWFLIAGLVENVSLVRSRSEEFLGKAAHRTVGSWKMADMFKTIIQSSTTNIHPGKWNSESHFMAEVSLKNPATGKEELQHSSTLQFKWPTEIEKKRLNASRITNAQKTAKDLLSQSQALGNEGFSIALSQWFDNLWQSIEESIDKMLFKIFGIAAAPIQWTVKMLLKILCKMVALALSPLYLVGMGLQRMHMARKVREFNENLNLPAHESLVRTVILKYFKAIHDEQKKLASLPLAEEGKERSPHYDNGQGLGLSPNELQSPARQFRFSA